MRKPQHNLHEVGGCTADDMFARATSQVALLGPGVDPRLDITKVAVFKEFRPGRLVPREGYVWASLHIIAFDELTRDTVAFYDFLLPDEGDDYFYWVINCRYALVDGLPTLVEEYPQFYQARFQYVQGQVERDKRLALLP